MSKHGIKINRTDILEEKYKVITHIASGGMSEVYLVEDIHDTGRLRAVKVVKKGNKLASKLIDETLILIQLNHPNIPKMIDFFSSTDYIYLVMEYAEGTVLSDYLKSNDHQISIDQVINIGIQLCDILTYLHHRSEPIIYRDIKPGNIILGYDGNVRLIDFGISRIFQIGKMEDTVKIGTVGFAAPEQFEKKQTDERTDLFSLGSLLYYMLSGGKYVYVVQKPISHFVKRLPTSLEKCINQLVELEPDRRIQDAEEAKRLLARATEELANRKPKLSHYKGITALIIMIVLAIFLLMI
jgi:serine/threonine protein kinase